MRIQSYFTGCDEFCFSRPISPVEGNLHGLAILYLYPGGIRLEQGMSVEIPTTGYNPPTSNGGNEVMAFRRIYGIDLKRAGACHVGYLDVVKIG